MSKIKSLDYLLNRRVVSNERIGKALLLIAFGIVFSLSITGQSEGDDSKGRTMVSVPVSVSDRDGRYISNLDKGDFSIYQDGVKQKISFFAKYDEPLNIALLLDTSGSTQESLMEIKEGAEDFINLLNENDRCMLVTFDRRINILSEFTADRKALKKSLDKAQTGFQDGTLLRNAVQQIAQNSFNNTEGRKVIVLLSDGKDLGSSTTRNQLVGYLEESDILIYTIFYKSGEGFQKLVIDKDGNVTEGKKPKKAKKPEKPKKPKKTKGYVLMIPGATAVPTTEEMKRRELDSDVEGVAVLRDLSETTAGRFYMSSDIDLGDTFKKVAAELRQQYRLGFYAKNASGEPQTHNIIVKVEREGAAVQTRGKFRSKL